MPLKSLRRLYLLTTTGQIYNVNSYYLKEIYEVKNSIGIEVKLESLKICWTQVYFLYLYLYFSSLNGKRLYSDGYSSVVAKL